MAALSTRRLGFLLFASVAINLFLGGLLVGPAARNWIGDAPVYGGMDHRRHPGAGPGKMHGSGRGLMGMRSEFSAEGQDAARDVMENRRAKMKPRFRAMRTAHRGVRDALVADPFEPIRLQQAFTELRTRGVETQLGIHTTMIDLATRLGPSDRLQMAAHMPGAFGRHGRRAHHFSPPPE